MGMRSSTSLLVAAACWASLAHLAHADVSEVSVPKLQRLGFGSCTQYNEMPQAIWQEAVIPTDIDAWIWSGDAFYGDDRPVGCGKDASIPFCTCNATWLQSPPFACNAGNLDNFRDKAYRAVTRPTYHTFLEHMCPGYLVSGQYPPIGDDSAACPKPIFGTWDDHDYGWNDGNKRLPSKAEFKETYLSFIGTQHTQRYNPLRGLEWAYSLKDGSHDVEVVLLDARYNRDTLPCFVRRDYCQGVIQNTTAKDYAWCEDFLVSGGLDGKSGSCCKKDEMFAEYCGKASDPATTPYFQEVCNVTSPTFAMEPLVVNEAGEVALYNHSMPDQVQDMSSMCEMLGPQQRQWLDATLAANKAPITLIVSGSVVLTNADVEAVPGPDLGFAKYETRSGVAGKGPCGGDDFSCYYRAASQLLATLGRYEDSTCYIIITGDWHFSDIKVLNPNDSNATYSQFHSGLGLSKPVWQVMASGMTASTVYPSALCQDFRKDSVGYRPLGECAFVRNESWGMVEFLWEEGVALLQIRDGQTGSNGTVLQQVGVNIETCEDAGAAYVINNVEPVPQEAAPPPPAPQVTAETSTNTTATSG